MNNNQERVQQVKELMHKHMPQNYNLNYVVLLIWESPFGNLDHRSAAFEEYTDAELYAEALEQKYKKLGLVHTVYMLDNSSYKVI